MKGEKRPTEIKCRMTFKTKTKINRVQPCRVRGR